MNSPAKVRPVRMVREDLKRLGACRTARLAFRKRYPRGVVVTPTFVMELFDYTTPRGGSIVYTGWWWLRWLVNETLMPAPRWWYSDNCYSLRSKKRLRDQVERASGVFSRAISSKILKRRKECRCG